jgi:hypothetical protein
VTYVFIKQSSPLSYCNLWTPAYCRSCVQKFASKPYPKVTALFCRFPWPPLHEYALGYSPRGTCVGSGYDHGISYLCFFNRSWAWRNLPQLDGYSWFKLGLSVTLFTSFIHLNREIFDDPIPPTLNRRHEVVRHRYL